MRFKSDLQTTEKSIKVFYAVVCVIFFLISGSVIPFMGLKTMPDILLCLCCILPKYLPRKDCCVYGILLGFFTDLLVGSPMHFSPVIYLVPCVFAPYLFSFFNRVGTVTAAVCSLPFLLLKGIVGSVYLMSTEHTVSLSFIISRFILPELLVNFTSVLIIGALLKGLSRFQRRFF